MQNKKENLGMVAARGTPQEIHLLALCPSPPPSLRAHNRPTPPLRPAAEGYSCDWQRASRVMLALRVSDHIRCVAKGDDSTVKIARPRKSGMQRAWKGKVAKNKSDPMPTPFQGSMPHSGWGRTAGR